MAKNYSEKLKDPRWQKKRLEIMQRDNFACQICGDNESTLHVHHMKYFEGKNPWEYQNDLLVTLCEDCHEVESSYSKDYLKLLCDSVRGKFYSGEIHRLACAIEFMQLQHVPEVVMSAICHALENEDQQRKIIQDYFDHLMRKREATTMEKISQE